MRPCVSMLALPAGPLTPAWNVVTPPGCSEVLVVLVLVEVVLVEVVAVVEVVLVLVVVGVGLLVDVVLTLVVVVDALVLVEVVLVLVVVGVGLLVDVVVLVEVVDVLLLLVVLVLVDVVVAPPVVQVTTSFGRLVAELASLLSNLSRLLCVASESWLMRSRSHPLREVSASWHRAVRAGKVKRPVPAGGV